VGRNYAELLWREERADHITPSLGKRFYRKKREKRGRRLRKMIFFLLTIFV